jgi:hypothetical protein
MAEWKRLTNIPGHPVDVNMDQVAFIECPQGVSELHFINDAAGPKGTVILNVRESLICQYMLRDKVSWACIKATPCARVSGRRFFRGRLDYRIISLERACRRHPNMTKVIAETLKVGDGNGGGIRVNDSDCSR